jgi:hypothetical protein
MVYNAGTAPADTVIKIAGNVGDGVLITNATTGQRCKVINVTPDVTTTVNKWVEFVSKTGECLIKDAVTTSSAYRYHDNGYINLAPSAPLKRDIAVTASGNLLASDIAVFDEGDVGKHVFVDGAFVLITGFNNARSVSLENNITDGSYVVTPILLNVITVTPLSTMSLTTFEIDYKHTFE